MDKEIAKRVMAAAGAKATQIGKPASVAIVDIAGAMVLFERFNNASSWTALNSEGKATGSAFTGRDSAKLEASARLTEMLQSRRFVASQGGVPLVDDSGVIGGIGVSGSSPQEDEDIARAGASAV